MARLEAENEFDKFTVSVRKCHTVIEHLSKGTSYRFAKVVSFFLRWSNENSFKIEFTGKRVNLGHGEML